MEKSAFTGRTLYLVLGFVCVGLAALGVALPLLPATPFLLLAAGCFARSSERWHNWLLSNATFGPLIRNWQIHRCIDRKIKFIALASLVLFGGTSLALLNSDWMRMTGSIFMLIGAVVVLRLKTCDDCRPQGQPLSAAGKKTRTDERPSS